MSACFILSHGDADHKTFRENKAIVRRRGAIVLPPKCAMYLDNPIACVDYASLYPSTMISQNYSHDSKDDDGNVDSSGSGSRSDVFASTNTSHQNKNVVKHAINDVFIVIDLILKEYPKEILDYAVWF